MPYVTLYATGGGDVSLGTRGTHTLAAELPPAHARQAAIDILVSHARGLEHPLDVEVSDIDAHLTLRIHKDGTVEVVASNHRQRDGQMPAALWTPPAMLMPTVIPDSPQPITDETVIVAARRSAPLRVSLVFSGGTTIGLDRTAILGRKPRAQDRYGDATLVEVERTDASISKTHCVVELANGQVEITDLGSTNGTSITREGIALELSPGTPAKLEDGDTVHLGDSSALARIVHDGLEDA